MTAALLPSEKFSSDQNRWQAVVQRDPAAASAFVYAVRTTGIFCRPGCAAKRPLRKNVQFFDSRSEARAAGFRPCRRCQPEKTSGVSREAELVSRACRQIEQATQAPSLAELADEAGLSRFHFQRLFKATTGVTPHEYATAHRTARVREQLQQGSSVTAAIYEAGFNTSSSFYATAEASLGMTPVAYRDGGRGTTIRFGLGQCSLGAILVAATQRGVCWISLGDDPAELVHELQTRFAQAELIGADAEFEQWLSAVIGLVDAPRLGVSLPLDIQGTAFQQRVWRALREIPPGSTTTYTALAQQLGLPTAVRAVASACAANSLAVAIPCHRVVRLNGNLAGYRWGMERKRLLLERELDS